MIKRTSALFVSAMIMSGCSSTATTGSFAMPQVQESNAVQLANYQSGDPLLVVISFPAVMDPQAAELWTERLVTGFAEEEDEQGDKGAASFSATESLNDAIYHATELYESLKARLPANSVILDPQRVVLEDGRLAYWSMIPGGPPPSLVNLSLATLDNPDRNQVMESPYLTFGDTMTAAITVSEGMPGLSERSPVLFETTFDGVCHNELEEAPLLDCLNGVDGLATFDRDRARAFERARAPAEKVRLDITITEVEDQTADTDRSDFVANPETVRGSFARSYDPLLIATVGYASDLYAQYRASSSDIHLRRYIAQVNGVPTPDGEAWSVSRVALARYLFAIESQALGATSDRMLREFVLEGEFGPAFRGTVATEAGLLETRRDLARSQNERLALMMLGSALVGGMAGATGNSAMNMPFIQMAELEGQRSTAEAQRSASLMSDFSGSWASTYADQIGSREMVIQGTGERISGGVPALRAVALQQWNASQ